MLSSPMQTRAPVLRPRLFTGMSSVTAGVSTRQGGVSAAPYATLNLGRHVDDDPNSVEENRRRFCAALDVDPAWLATAGQVHGSTVRVIDAPRHEPFCDGLVTTTPELLLAIATADCAAILMADPVNRVAGACHAGWRGTVKEIAVKTVRTMEDVGADSENIHVYVGPCISRSAFEVGPDVARRFDDEFVHERADWRRPHVDLKAALRSQLERAGIMGESIEVSEYCPVTDTDTFFSHRASDGETGRMFGAIVLRN